MMKKGFIAVMCALLVLTGCSSAGQGAYIGGQFGHVIGSAIGGIAGGPRGYDWGSLIGTVGGAVAGAAIGSAVDKSQSASEAMPASSSNRRMVGKDASAVDDRIYFDDEPLLEIRNAVVLESLRDGVLTRGEECKVGFEIHNTSDEIIFDVRPLVEDVTGNKHVKISPNLLIESIGPHQAVRYSATILADSQLRNGEIVVMVGVAQGDKEVTSQTRRFVVPTAKKAQ